MNILMIVGLLMVGLFFAAFLAYAAFEILTDIRENESSLHFFVVLWVLIGLTFLGIGLVLNVLEHRD